MTATNPPLGSDGELSVSTTEISEHFAHNEEDFMRSARVGVVRGVDKVDNLHVDLPTGKGLSFIAAGDIARRSFSRVVVVAGYVPPTRKLGTSHSERLATSWPLSAAAIEKANARSGGSHGILDISWQSGRF